MYVATDFLVFIVFRLMDTLVLIVIHRDFLCYLVYRPHRACSGGVFAVGERQTSMENVDTWNYLQPSAMRMETSKHIFQYTPGFYCSKPLYRKHYEYGRKERHVFIGLTIRCQWYKSPSNSMHEERLTSWTKNSIRCNSIMLKQNSLL